MAEIGYGIVPSRQGIGHATEAVRMLVPIAWEDRQTDAVAASTDVKDVASQRVLEKAAFNALGETGLLAGFTAAQFRIAWRRVHGPG